MKIMTRLLAGFSLILAAMLLVGLLGARSIEHLAGLTGEIFRHPFTVMTNILELKAELLLQQRNVTRLVHSGGIDAVAAFEQNIAERTVVIDRNMELVRERFGGDPRKMDDLFRARARWRAARNEVAQLMRGGRTAEALALNDGVAAALAEALIKEVDDVRDLEIEKAESFKRSAEQESLAAVTAIVVTLVLILAGGIAVAALITRSVGRSLRHVATEVQMVIDSTGDKARIAEAISAGDLSPEIPQSTPLKVDVRDLPGDDLGSLLLAAVRLSEVQCALDESFRKMSHSLRHGREVEEAGSWLKGGLNELYARLRVERDAAELAHNALSYLVEYLQAGVGALYLYDEQAHDLRLAATFACPPEKQPAGRIRFGEGVVGQAARDHKTIHLTEVPAGYLPVTSALGTSDPAFITVVPLLQGEVVVGVLEIGAFRELAPVEREFLGLAQEAVAIGLQANLSRQQTVALLEETQQQAEELRVQQEELQQSNEELEERAQMLEQQRTSIQAKNREIEAASQDLQEKAAELERVSAYKSEFLANMSHELRTPLNSLMILSGLLMQNKDGNLTDKQVEYVATINSAGTDLLNLINDILDLSKIEAGHMQLQRDDVAVAELCDSVQALFAPLAEKKGLELSVGADAQVPALFLGDRQRVLQILRNLLSNAIKFTERGRVGLRVAVAPAADNPLAVPALAFTVSDTGIGISPAQQQAVFEAFRQADGSISRKYGGTGLGLSISLQLAHKMQGDLRLESREGEGSVFTLHLPLLALGEMAPATQPIRPAGIAPRPARRAAVEAERPVIPAPISDDRDRITAGDRSILVIEDDLDFLRPLAETIRERGFAVLAANDGESGIALAERYLPSAVILDVMLPHMNGWAVMRSLKDNPQTRHIPVHFITCLEDRQKAMAMGAIGFVTKPIGTDKLERVFQSIEGNLAKAVKQLLIVEDNADEASSMVALLEEKDVEITVATGGQAAIGLLATGAFDCLVLDLGLSDMSGFEVLDHIRTLDQARQIPIIIHSGRDLGEEDERRLRRYAESIIIKGAKSPERLLNEVSLFLHLVEGRLNPGKQRMIRTAIDKEAMLEGRKVLLVDDDMRNIFSVSSVLEEKGMIVVEAENGREALARLQEHADVSIVLMDIMMPEMDGYAAMREIRKEPRFANLPLIAMTAKALKGDHEKCMAAGASDYITKPVELQKLLSLLRVWLYQQA